MAKGTNESSDLPKRRVREGGAMAKRVNKGLRHPKAVAARKKRTTTNRKSSKRGKGYR